MGNWLQAGDEDRLKVLLDIMKHYDGMMMLVRKNKTLYRGMIRNGICYCKGDD